MRIQKIELRPHGMKIRKIGTNYRISVTSITDGIR